MGHFLMKTTSQFAFRLSIILTCTHLWSMMTEKIISVTTQNWIRWKIEMRISLLFCVAVIYQSSKQLTSRIIDLAYIWSNIIQKDIIDSILNPSSLKANTPQGVPVIAIFLAGYLVIFWSLYKRCVAEDWNKMHSC